ELSVPSRNAVLVVSYIGYVTQELPVGTGSMRIVLQSDESELGEVVVTAMGITRERRSLSYSVTQVSGDNFVQARDNNVASALTGMVAGVDATQINAGPGSSSR